MENYDFHIRNQCQRGLKPCLLCNVSDEFITALGASWEARQVPSLSDATPRFSILSPRWQDSSQAEEVEISNRVAEEESTPSCEHSSTSVRRTEPHEWLFKSLLTIYCVRGITRHWLCRQRRSLRLGGLQATLGFSKRTLQRAREQMLSALGAIQPLSHLLSSPVATGKQV